MAGRVLLLIAAFLVAGLGALLVYLYAQQADERALAEYDPVQVVMVQGAVPAGTAVDAAIEQGLLAVEEVPGAGVPDRAAAALADVTGKVVLSDLVTGEPLVLDRVGDPDQQERISVPAGQLALSFAFADPNRVAGFVAPGSKVAVLLTYGGPGAPAATDDDQTGAAPPADGVTRVLLDQVSVLAVGATSASEVPGQDDGEAAPVSQTVLTLALTQGQAESMVHAQSIGALYLGLRGDDAALAPGEGSTSQNLFEVVGR